MEKFKKNFIKLMKNKVFWIIFMIVVILVLIGVMGYKVYSDIKAEIKGEPKAVVEENTYVEREFEGFKLYKDTTEYQKELFTKLEEAKNTIDVNGVGNYVDVYAQNFIADYLTLSVKDLELNRLGGRTFITDPLKERYIDSYGVWDYYMIRNYYVADKENLDTTLLPEVTGLTLTSSEETTYSFVDEKGLIPSQTDIPAYRLTYTIEYVNKDTAEMSYYDSISVVVANWDGVWTVVEVTF